MRSGSDLVYRLAGRLVRLQLLQRLADQLPPHFFFLLRREFSVANNVNDAVAEHDSVGADHFGNGQRRGDLHGGDAGFF